MSQRLDFLEAELKRQREAPPGQRPSHVITRTMEEVARIVNRLANARGEMPTNPILGDLAGNRGRSSVFRALRRLAHANIITIERKGDRRRCTVVETGRSTDWGEARPGHSPYIHRRPGDATPCKPLRKVRAPQSRPMPSELPAPAVFDPGPLVITRAATCQYPLWADGERTFYGVRRFCDDASTPGRSYCAFHVILCYREHPARPGGGHAPLDKRDFQASTRRKGLEFG